MPCVLVQRAGRPVLDDEPGVHDGDAVADSGSELEVVGDEDQRQTSLPPLLVEASMRFSYSIFLVASLGYLGLGVQPPSPDWGLQINEARNFFSLAPWVLLFPACTIAVLVVSTSLMSDGLRQVMLPGGGRN